MSDQRRSKSVEELKDRVRSQFGTHADRYATSTVHAQGESLKLLERFMAPRAEGYMLDVATAAGHTAMRFAPRVQRVIGVDLTRGTIEAAQTLAAERGISNLTFSVADAEALPFAEETFNLVTCRLAFHHMPNAEVAIAEMARVCRAGGWVGLVDNIVPEDQASATWINEFETIRDPSHHQLWPLSAIETLFERAGLTIEKSETLVKPMDFDQWTWRTEVLPADKTRLRAMLLDAPPAIHQWLAPSKADGRLQFNLVEGIIVGKK